MGVRSGDLRQFCGNDDCKIVESHRELCVVSRPCECSNSHGNSLYLLVDRRRREPLRARSTEGCRSVARPAAHRVHDPDRDDGVRGVSAYACPKRGASKAGSSRPERRTQFRGLGTRLAPRSHGAHALALSISSQARHKSSLEKTSFFLRGMWIALTQPRPTQDVHRSAGTVRFGGPCFVAIPLQSCLGLQHRRLSM